jgi:hypothetical protein
VQELKAWGGGGKEKGKKARVRKASVHGGLSTLKTQINQQPIILRESSENNDIYLGMVMQKEYAYLGKLWAYSKRLRQGKVLKDKSEEDYMRLYEIF